MKILVIQQKMIGDVLTSSILLEALRKKYPEAELHYLIYRHTFPVVEKNPNIDTFVLYDDRLKKPGQFYGFSQSIRNQQYDIIIDVYSKIGSALITRISGASKRISYHKWYTSKAYTHTFKPTEELQTNAGFAIENRMQLLQAISPDFPVKMKPKIWLTEEEKVSAKKLLEAKDVSKEKPLIMCGILGSSSEKTYPLPYMAKILDFIVEKTGAQLLFNYIPGQVEEASRLYDLCNPQTRKLVFFDIFGTGIRDFIAFTSHCDALIGNEGGAVNMAKALNIPTFSIFSPQIKKENWSIYEDGKQNVSVHLRDFHPRALDGFTKKEITKKAAAFYEQLKPNLIFAPLKEFLQLNVKR